MNMNRVPRNMVTYVVSMYIVCRDDDGCVQAYRVTQNSIVFSSVIYSIVNATKSVNLFERLH